MKKLSLSAAVKAIKQIPGMTATLRDGEIQVRRKHAPIGEGYFTTDAQDAIDTAEHISKNVNSLR